MRKTALATLAAGLGLALLPMQPILAAEPQGASATEVPDQPLSDGTIQAIGPGTYESASKSFNIPETDVSAGLMGRSHRVVAQLQGISQPQDAPTNRSDLGVFGPSWEAEFLGGQLNRKLTPGSGSITTTDLAVNESTRYDLTDSVAGPNGGSVNTYTAADGSKLVETVKWDDLAGALKTTVVETLNIDLASPVEGDDVPVDALGNPVSAADLKPSITYKQVGGGGDNWRVTATGNVAYKLNTVSYDSVGRVSTINLPASPETLAESIKVNYATTTTASSGTLGDVTGRVKDITRTSGQTVETLARYSYDGSGLLRKVTNPTEGTDLSTYTYDTNERLATVADSLYHWDLSYPGDTSAPDAVQTAGPPPADLDEPLNLPDPTHGPARPQADMPPNSPSWCNYAQRWIWKQISDCVTTVAHYGWHAPSKKKLPNGRDIMGITYDHCTSSPDKPGGYDFRTACDGHDYAYGVIGNWYKRTSRYMNPNLKLDADAAFYDLLKNQTCPAYRSQAICGWIAGTYHWAVRWGGNPQRGATATH
ncbi:phospholipase A2 [Streptomyces sp. NPDC060187]|uniref:phospholipase A2 n=1 Tax=Streptomyces sp. NPDC060187 TaxID=3347067 RepID=UPI0036680121